MPIAVLSPYQYSVPGCLDGAFHFLCLLIGDTSPDGERFGGSTDRDQGRRIRCQHHDRDRDHHDDRKSLALAFVHLLPLSRQNEHGERGPDDLDLDRVYVRTSE